MSQFKLIPYNPVDHFQDEESQASLLTDAFESNDASYIEHAFNIVARARGLAQSEETLNMPSIVAMLTEMNLRLDLKPTQN